MVETQSPDAFMASAPRPVGGSSPWSARYAVELRRVIHEHAARAPRTLQSHLGPSEIGVACDRQVAGKMAALPATNHVSDPWPSIVGTACHAWAADAFEGDNLRTNVLRWVAEQRVTPHPDHPGTADLYDAVEQTVCDHKFLGASSMQKIIRGLVAGAPIGTLKPRHYVVQLVLYGLGYIRMGLPVKRVALAAYPRTAASLDGLHVWDLEITSDGFTLLPEVAELVEQVYTDTARRREYAADITAGLLTLNQIPAAPDGDTCFFCPYYRPQSAHDGQAGCPGTVASG